MLSFPKIENIVFEKRNMATLNCIETVLSKSQRSRSDSQDKGSAGRFIRQNRSIDEVKILQKVSNVVFITEKECINRDMDQKCTFEMELTSDIIDVPN